MGWFELDLRYFSIQLDFLELKSSYSIQPIIALKTNLTQSVEILKFCCVIKEIDREARSRNEGE